MIKDQIVNRKSLTSFFLGFGEVFFSAVFEVYPSVMMVPSKSTFSETCFVTDLRV